MNPLGVLALQGHFQEVLATYGNLDDPTPEDDRWAAVAMLNLNRVLEARDLLLRARGRGLNAANLELSEAHRMLGEPKEALYCLDALELGQLDPVDRAMERRERGAVAFMMARYGEAISHLESAWAIIQGDQLDQYVPSVSHALGFFYLFVGQHSRALHYLSKALSQANPARSARVHISRARCFGYLGNQEKAQQELQSASELLDHVPAARAIYEQTGGIIALDDYRLHDAIRHFESSIELAKASQDVETELYGLLYLCFVQSLEGQSQVAQTHLKRAKGLVGQCGPKGEVTFNQTKAFLLMHEGNPDCLPLFELAQQQFAEIELQRDACLTRLFIAEAHLHFQRYEDATAQLNIFNDMRIELDSPGILSKLICTPKVLIYLHDLTRSHPLTEILRDWESGPRVPVYHVYLRTLGLPELRLNGKRVGLDISRVVELIAYLVQHPNQPRDSILAALFEDRDVERAINYFHQAKLVLRRASDVISIQFNKENQTYSVHCTAPIFSWDCQELERTLKLGDTDRLISSLDHLGWDFLPNSEGEWVVNYREQLHLKIIHQCIIAIQDVIGSGDHEKCFKLSELGLRIDPLNIELNVHLIDAIKFTQGPTQAKVSLDLIERKFHQELGEIPHKIHELRQKIHL